jgi:hypothetical protein
MKLGKREKNIRRYRGFGTLVVVLLGERYYKMVNEPIFIR